MGSVHGVFERVFEVAREVAPVAGIHLQALQYRWELCGDIDGIDAGQYQQAVFDPLAAVFEITTAVMVFATQEGTAHTA